MEKDVGKKRFSYWWLILIVIIGIWIYVQSQPDKNITFVVASGDSWISCWSETSNLTVNYDLSSSSEVDLLFTPTRADAENLSETSKHYPSCYVPNVLSNKDSCIIEGKGCMMLLNKNSRDATINLKYSAKKIE